MSGVRRVAWVLGLGVPALWTLVGLSLVPWGYEGWRALWGLGAGGVFLGVCWALSRAWRG
jgi:hypothetical protein